MPKYDLKSTPFPWGRPCHDLMDGFCDVLRLCDSFTYFNIVVLVCCLNFFGFRFSWGWYLVLNCANGTILLVNVYLGVLFLQNQASLFFYIVTVTIDICETIEHVSGWTLLKFVIK